MSELRRELKLAEYSEYRPAENDTGDTESYADNSTHDAALDWLDHSSLHNDDSHEDDILMSSRYFTIQNISATCRFALHIETQGMSVLEQVSAVTVFKIASL